MGRGRIAGPSGVPRDAFVAGGPVLVSFASAEHTQGHSRGPFPFHDVASCTRSSRIAQHAWQIVCERSILVVGWSMEKIMKNLGIWGVKALGAGFILLLATSTFADSRPQKGTTADAWRHGKQSRDERRIDRGDRQRGTEVRQSDRARAAEDSRTRASRRSDADRREGRAAIRNDENRGARRDDSRSSEAYRDNRAYRNNGADRGGAYRGAQQYRDRGRVTNHGRITRYSHEHGGYRVWLQGVPYAYWIPEAHWRNNWRIGIGISLGGIFRNGMIYADVYDNPYYNDPYYGGSYGRYNDDYVSGYVDSIDYRTGRLWLQDERNGRLVTIDTRSIDPRVSGIDARDLRRGDRVTVVGQWLRGDVFAAGRIDSVRTGRY